MLKNNPSESLKQLCTIPGVGKSIAQDLLNIGITRIHDLKHAEPEKLYERINNYYGVKQDVCLLYVMRCAVYYASSEKHDAEMLKWWNWK